MPHPEKMRHGNVRDMMERTAKPEPPAYEGNGGGFAGFFGCFGSPESPTVGETLRRHGIEAPASVPSLAEEVAKLRETVEEMVYWMRPQMGQIVTGKADVEEFERLMGRNP